MLEIVISKEKFEFLDETAQEIIDILRNDFSVFEIKDIKIDRPLLSSNENLTFYSFAGSKINKTLKFILDRIGIKSHFFDDDSSFVIKHIDKDFISTLKDLNLKNINIDQVLSELIEKNPGMLDFSKWGHFLPIKYQLELLKTNYFDFEGCNQYLQNLHFIEN